MKIKSIFVSLQQHMPYFRKRMVWEILHRKLLWGLSQQADTDPVGDQPFVVYSQRPWKQLLSTLCSCVALDPGPGPGKMHSQAHLPFLLYLRYYFCKETLVLWKGWGASLSWRETAFHFSSAILFLKGSSLTQSLIGKLRKAWKESWFLINCCC